MSPGYEEPALQSAGDAREGPHTQSELAGEVTDEFGPNVVSLETRANTAGIWIGRSLPFRPSFLSKKKDLSTI